MRPVDSLVPPPASGRIFASRRRIRLSDRDAGGRLRLDAVARYLQDVASDDVDETGWGAPGHLWVVRRTRIDVLDPVLADGEVELATWCSGLAPSAAGRRTSLAGVTGGRIEVESVWIHLGPDARPARLDDTFGVYGAAAGGRRVATKLTLPQPPTAASGTPWPLRAADVDLLGHVNNAVHWAAVEDRLPGAPIDAALPFRALLDYHRPLDVGDDLRLVPFDGGLSLAFVADGSTKAVARLEALRNAG
jgi:acyl-ACP thioesterase